MQQFHVWSDEWVGQGDWMEGWSGSRQDGQDPVFRRFRSTTSSRPTRLALVNPGVVDTVQVIYNIFEQSPEDELFPPSEPNVGVIVRVPLDEGGLTGKITAETHSRRRLAQRLLRRGCKEEVSGYVEAITNDLGCRSPAPRDRPSLLLTHPAVSTVIPGMRALAMWTRT